MDANQSQACIGVFDSGLGGLTVVRRINELMPGESIVYLGDSARVPYGTKSAQTVRDFAAADAKFLMRFEPKLLVIACNTASAMALDYLRGQFDIPIIGVIDGGAQWAVKAAKDKPIGVMGTSATIESGAYQRAISELCPGSDVHTAACPLLAPIVEDGRDQDDPLIRYVLEDYLRQMQRIRPAALVLGCTHYPLLANSISKMMGPDTELIDSGKAAASEVKKYLQHYGLLNAQNHGRLECFTTDNPQRFAQLAGRFLGREIDSVSRVGTDELTLTVIE